MPYIAPKEGLVLDKTDSIAPYGAQESSKKKPSRESSSKDLKNLLEQLSPEQIVAGWREVGQMQKEELLQGPED